MSIIKIESEHINAGVISGLIAGVVFGAMMAMMGMLPMIAKLLGGSSALFGFVLHLIFSMVIGAIFAIFLGHAAADRMKGITLGIIYGVIWWFLGPLTLMPLWLGMGIQLSPEGMQAALPSLWGHLVYGFILGLIYPMIVGLKPKN
ncbi:hypothetical protein HYT00_00640 [Candidatus Giovannonibacteria bacterium]|nr:hypothetical protein [Candidatus Giovannonibacteria bacterium]